MNPYTLSQIRGMIPEWLEWRLNPLFVLISPLVFAITLTYHYIKTQKYALLTMGARKKTL